MFRKLIVALSVVVLIAVNLPAAVLGSSSVLEPTILHDATDLKTAAEPQEEEPIYLPIITKGASPASYQVEAAGNGNWWDVTPEDENPSPFYDSILYSEIAPKLREIELNSNRVKVEVIGQSAGGRNLFLVTLSAPEALGRLGQYQAIRAAMLKDPEKALELIDKFGDFKVPVFINGSIHGNEYPGVDTAIRLIETLAYGDSPEVRAILENVILLVNVVQNPDGRVAGTRSNANGFDLNRDYISMTQPETKALVNVFTEWNPMVVLDLHGFVNPMLIEPCTPPHNPNYEYDLYIQWAFDQALAMEAELIEQTDETEALIPFRDWDSGWDDWAPSYTPMYAMYHGAYGHTLETPYRDDRGVSAQYAAVWGALKFITENRQAMVRDQVEIFRRGFLDLPQMLIPDEILAQTPWDQYNELTITDFPAAYVIPPDAPQQISDHQVARLIDFLLFNDVQVEQASKAFVLDGIEYPKDTYVVWMDQPKRGLANTILDSGPDLSDIAGLTFYSPPSVWSHPLLWGVQRVAMQEKMDIATHAVNNAKTPKGSNDGGRWTAYGFMPNSIAVFQATNEMLRQDVPLYRTTAPFEDSGRAFGSGMVLLPGDSSLANQLANRYALDLVGIDSVPPNAVQMYPQRIAVYGDSGVAHALEQLGFEYEMLSLSTDLDLDNFDVFVNQSLRWSQLSGGGPAEFTDFFADGGDYISLGNRGQGVGFALDAGIVDVDFAADPSNAIVRMSSVGDSDITSGFGTDSTVFVYRPVWFTRLGDGVEVAANYASDDFLVAGYWPDWPTSGAAGSPMIVYSTHNDTGDSVLLGLDSTFRGHPEDAFRLLGNAIYHGLD
jgi:hypothetical protein